jgi:hypothetical protein
VLILGYPKSGNTWFCYLLAYSLNVLYDNLAEPAVHPRDEWQRKLVKGNLHHKSYIKEVNGIWSTHQISKLSEYLNREFLIYLLRDGRDVMVSYYCYLNRVVPEELRQSEQMGLFKYFSSRIKSKFSSNFSMFIKERSLEWKDHIEKSLVQKPDMIVKYEDLHQDTCNALKTIFEKMKLDVEETVIQSAIDKFSFNKCANREKGEEDVKNFYRKGIVGDWHNYFQGRDVSYFKNIAGDLLIELGYEKDYDW